MDKVTHIRFKHCIQDKNTRKIESFSSIAEAKKHSLHNHHKAGTLRVVEKLLPAEK